jgi:mono/diheme cytochrome c family protein
MTYGAKLVSVPEPIIPVAPGVEAFQMNCITCHSARYVQMQPDFPEKTWAKIVDKMIKTYGAPITDSTAKTIVAYLNTIKGIQ